MMIVQSKNSLQMHSFVRKEAGLEKPVTRSIRETQGLTFASVQLLDSLATVAGDFFSSVQFERSL